MTAGIAVALLIGIQGCTQHAIRQPLPSQIDTYTQNIRAGLAATTGFDLVADVPTHNAKTIVDSLTPLSPLVRGVSLAYAKIITYPLHQHPATHRYRTGEQRLNHIQWVTLAWKAKQYPFIADLYLHGDTKSDSLVVRVPHLDIRKFLHPSIAPLAYNQTADPSATTLRLAQLQAYFAEFARKGRILYPLSDENTRSYETATRRVLYERLLEEVERLGKDKAIRNEDPSSSDAVPMLMRAIDTLAQDGPLRLDIVHRNLQLAIALKNRETLEIPLAPSVQRGKKKEDYQGSLRQLEEIVHQLNVAQRIASVTITNNCREPGLYEVEIKDGEGRMMFHANFAFHTELYDQILTQYHGLGIREQGTGIRIPSAIRKQDRRRYWESFLPWKWLKSFPRVTVDALSVLHGSAPNEPIPTASGTIKVIRGEIPFEEHKIVVRRKSQYYYQGFEPLSYVRVDPDLPMPTGFSSPSEVIPALYWAAKENASRVVPHHFRTYEDVWRYSVFFSEFDLNGVYVGQSELKEWKQEREDGRWPFNFRYLKNLVTYVIRHTGQDVVEIRLYSQSAGRYAINFVFGNVALDVGETVEFLLGIGVQPVIGSYNVNEYKDPLLYGVAFEADGTVLDHHRLDIGVEQVAIQRIGEQSYKIQLISYERILPVWEGIVE